MNNTDFALFICETCRLSHHGCQVIRFYRFYPDRLDGNHQVFPSMSESCLPAKVEVDDIAGSFCVNQILSDQ